MTKKRVFHLFLPRKQYLSGLVASLLVGFVTLMPTTVVAANAKASGPVVMGNTPSGTPVTVSIIFKVQHQMQLQRFISEVSQPGPLFRHYLSVSQFAKQYGRSPKTIQRLVQYLGQYGITATTLSNNLVVTAKGTAGAFDQAMQIHLQNYSYKGQSFHAVQQAPILPAGMGGKILAVLGLSNYLTNHNLLSQPVGSSSTSTSTSNSPPANMNTPATVVNRYDVQPLYQNGQYGQGQTIGIVTLASFQPQDAYTFWQDVKIPVLANRISVVPVDGGAGPVSLQSGSTETTVDVEQSGALAPQAKIVVYEAPNGGGTGFVDAYFQAVTQDVAGSISSSWGTSETAVQRGISLGFISPGYPQAFTEAYMQGAAEGISMFAAAGDAGAYSASRAVGGPKNLSIGMPSDSPYVTSAGGTTLPGTQVYKNFSLTVPHERAWGRDYLFPYWSQFGFSSEAAWATLRAVGGGGGYSAFYATPSYQSGVSGVNQYSAVPWLTPIDNNQAWSFNANPGIVTGTASGRNVPDLAMNADPQTGYAVYSSLFSSKWAKIGGTSFVAPQLAGLTALINGSVGERVGFWNPQIYAMAQSSSSPFRPLNTTGPTNDNLYYTGTSGTLYNPATGLGTPNIASLAKAFATN